MTFELAVTRHINDYFKEMNHAGIAYRLKQSKYTDQKCDVLVDSPSGYVAIECKTTKYGLYFSSNFSDKQVEHMTAFVQKSGRKGFLIAKFKKDVSCIPWEKVAYVYEQKQKGLNELIASYKINFKELTWVAVLFR